MKKKNNTSKILKRLLSYTKNSKLELFFAIFFAFVSVLASLTLPLLIGKIVDQLNDMNNFNKDLMMQRVILFVICTILCAISQWFCSDCTNKLAYKTTQALRTELYLKWNHVPLSYIDTTPHGDLLHLMINDIDTISTGLLQGFTQLFTGVCTILGTLIFMFSIHWILAIIVICITPISLFTAGFIAKRNHKMYQLQMQHRGKLGAYSEEMIDNMRLIQAFSYETTAIESFDQLNAPIYSTGVTSHFYSAMVNPCTRFVNGLVYSLVGMFGALLIVRNPNLLTIGRLTSFLTYSSQYTKPFNEISGVVTELQSAFAAADRLFVCFDQREEAKEEDKAILQNVAGNIQFEDISFRYVENKPLIENFSFHIMPGEKIAIVGPTGCGKTTMINLLMRFYEVNSGNIYIDGTKTSDVTRQSVRSQFGMVLQDSWLFHGTIFDNIAYGKSDATFEEVKKAAQLAHADSFIERLPNGYDTMINESQDNISQGQKQLICIARIMLLNPPMLILDEATSSIDTRTEILIQNTFLEMMKNKTSIIVAHRLSTIKEADHIIVMKDGHILEVGNHQQLLEKKGFYSELYNSQFEKNE